MQNILTRSLIRISTLRWLLAILLFTVLSVATPLIAHQFHLAGQIFLPMHFFVFVAALALGWRAGFLVGLFSPFLSYALSGMPLLPILPIVTSELVAYGLLAGLMREKMGLNSFFSLIAAMVSGRIILALAVQILGNPLGPISYVEKAVVTGWPGLLIQLAFVPVIVRALQAYLKRNEST